MAKRRTDNTMAKRRTDNTMTNKKDRQWPKEGQTMAKRRTDNGQKKDRQYNGQKKKTNNGPQNTTQKTKDSATRTKLKTGDLLRFRRLAVHSPLVTPVILLVLKI
jgi:hypothetical protein